MAEDLEISSAKELIPGLGKKKSGSEDDEMLPIGLKKDKPKDKGLPKPEDEQGRKHLEKEQDSKEKSAKDKDDVESPEKKAISIGGHSNLIKGAKIGAELGAKVGGVGVIPGALAGAAVGAAIDTLKFANSLSGTKAEKADHTFEGTPSQGGGTNKEVEAITSGAEKTLGLADMVGNPEGAGLGQVGDKATEAATETTPSTKGKLGNLHEIGKQIKTSLEPNTKNSPNQDEDIKQDEPKM